MVTMEQHDRRVRKPKRIEFFQDGSDLVVKPGDSTIVRMAHLSLNRDWERNVNGRHVRRTVRRVVKPLLMPRDTRHISRRELVLRERDLVVVVEIPEPFGDTPRRTVRVGAEEGRERERESVCACVS